MLTWMNKRSHECNGHSKATLVLMQHARNPDCDLHKTLVLMQHARNPDCDLHKTLVLMQHARNPNATRS
jgi:hypothetical protein